MEVPLFNSSFDQLYNSTQSLSAITHVITSAVNIILGLPTNVYVLWLIVKGGRKDMNSDFFALNLSVAEVSFCVLSLTHYLCIFSFPSLYDTKYPKMTISAFSTGFLFTGRPLFQCCVCVERYIAVVHPVFFLKYKLLRYKVICSGFNWLLVLLSCVLCLLLFGALEMLFYCIFSMFLLMFSVQLFCCLAVLRALKRPGPGEGDREREGTNIIKMRAFKTITLILFSMVVSYLPVILLGFVVHLIDAFHFFFYTTVCFSVIIFCGFVQPLLYLHRSGKLPCLNF